MKFSGLFVAGFAASAMAAAIERRANAQTILNDLSTVSSQLTTVYNDISTFQGGAAGTAQALQIQSDSNKVANTLNQAAQDAAALPLLSNSDTASIALAIAGLTPNIYSTLELLTAKEPAFTTAALGLSATGIVKNTVQQLKTATDNFGGNITLKFVPSVAKLAPLVIGQIDYHFVQTIQAFSS